MPEWMSLGHEDKCVGGYAVSSPKSNALFCLQALTILSVFSTTTGFLQYRRRLGRCPSVQPKNPVMYP